MKKFDKNPSLQDENYQQFRQTTRSNGKYLKFQRIKKQSTTIPAYYHINQGNQNTQRKYIYDQQTMNDMIISLKQQNNQLKNIIKILQTQISYYEEQERNMIINTSNPNNKGLKNQQNIINDKKKIELHNHRLKKDHQKLEQQINKIKKTIKYTTIKELQTQIYVYEQQIKNLTAQLTASKKSMNNIQEINTIIQKQYYSGLKIKQLQSTIDNKSKQLEQSAKIIRKMKSIICQKNNQIQSFKSERQKIQNIFTKNKTNDQYVPKSELIAKKKQLLAMTETIQKLQVKLLECEAKAQALQQENIENMNRQTNKRKEILNQFQKLKKTYECLKKDMSNSCKISSDLIVSIKHGNSAESDSLFGKQKIPQVVKQQLIEQTIQTIIFNLQKNNIDHKSAPLLLRNQTKQKQDLGITQKPQLLTKQSLNNQNQVSQQQINIRQIIQCLQYYPFNLQNYEQKVLLARYLVQSQSDNDTIVNFDSFINISYVRSVFKLLLQQYPLFNQDQISQICLIVQDILRRNEHTLKTILYKLESQKAQTKQQQKNLMINSKIKNNQKKKGSFRCYDYIEAIIKQNQLTSDIIKFMKYWAFAQKQSYLSYKQFMDMFKIEGVCTFITEDPNNDPSLEQINQNNLKNIDKQQQKIHQEHKDKIYIDIN